MPFHVKICGLRTPEMIEAAVGAGADFLGLVFFPCSPRAVTIEQASDLTHLVPRDVSSVGLLVDPSDAHLFDAVQAGIDIVQLHGGETPARVAEVREKYGRPVIKALPISGPEDVVRAREYEDAADFLLFDAKPPKDANRPGGNAAAFDWTLLSGTRWSKPWLLAGGLTPENVADAVQLSGAPGVDVSSGVEDSPGEKSAPKIKAFVEAAREVAGNAAV